MTTVYNPILIGYAWHQDFSVEPDSINLDATLWLNFRRAGYCLAVVTGPYEFELVSPNLYRLSLTAEQTQLLHVGAVQGDLIITEDNQDVPSGVRITVPVEKVI